MKFILKVSFYLLFSDKKIKFEAMKKVFVRLLGATPAVITGAETVSSNVVDWKDLLVSLLTLILSFFGDKIFKEKEN